MALSLRSLLMSAALSAAALAAQATSLTLPADGTWQAFAIDSLSAQSGGVEWIDATDASLPGFGSPLSFGFTIAAGQQGVLTVVDTSMAGDTFRLFNHGAWLGDTSTVGLQQYGSAPDVGLDADAALVNPAFSRGTFTLGAGTYLITGELAQSLMLDEGGGQLSPINATAGALRLTVSPVPEPSSLALVLAAIGLVWRLSRRMPTR
jgi:hypothetical protein